MSVQKRLGALQIRRTVSVALLSCLLPKVTRCFSALEFFYWPLAQLGENAAARKVRFASAPQERTSCSCKRRKKSVRLAMCTWLAHLVAASCWSTCRVSCRPFFHRYTKPRDASTSFLTRGPVTLPANTREITPNLIAFAKTGRQKIDRVIPWQNRSEFALGLHTANLLIKF